MPARDHTATPAELLAAAYSQLEFEHGSLFEAARKPADAAAKQWLEKGDWLALADEVGAEKIFFVDQNPVIVFAAVSGGKEEDFRRLYNRVWCMARPQLLFLARPGELAVYDLARPPLKPGEAPDALDQVTTAAAVQTQLAAYHREKIETGALFGDTRFGTGVHRSDRALIRDLKVVRHELMAVKARDGKRPKLPHLHSLIGRAIFVRYLEDRKILVPEYFEKVAARRKSWARLLAEPFPGEFIEPSMRELRFLRVLRDREFTYALFDQLADDFNGDTFPVEDEERERVHEGHLEKLRGFLVGEPSQQQELFFFAYRFDVIPIELISSIYEEFYNEREGKERNQGSHYTPPALVEFVLAHTLTPDVLATKPRVFDPACGSGIFLVESYRRMVRHLWAEQGGRRLSRAQLRKLLREQIAGVDINEEAVRVAAFSLYLAFLHYQEPREINAERRLPYLKSVPAAERAARLRKNPAAEFFDVLLQANAFDPVSDGATGEIAARFGSGCADVVVGNPPWGYPKKEHDPDGHAALAGVMQWCDAEKGRPIGDKELSQAFVHLALDLLRDGGKAGMLLSSGVFFKHHANSRAFREVWLNSSRLRHVVNFAHVRHVFFSGPQRAARGIAPFVSAIFEKTKPRPGADQFEYWSAKRTATVENTQVVVLNHGDLHRLSQSECLDYEKLWKIYWWGGHRDESLVRALERFPKLSALPRELRGTTLTTGRGFQEGNKKDPSDWLTKYRELPSELFLRYGSLDIKRLRTVPDRVERRGVEAVYHGQRLLVARGIREDGFITARLETRAFCFRNSIHGVRLNGFDSWQEKVLLGIFWSSVSRYLYFVTTGSWGLWHDEIHLENVEEMPIAFPTRPELRDRIVRIVEELQGLELQPDGLELGGMAAQRRLPALERELDDAIFDLYELNAAQRDLVREMCGVGLDLFYRHHKSDAVQPVAPPERPWGSLAEVANAESGLAAYLRTFLEIWNHELEPDGEFAWRVLTPPTGAPLLAVRFETRFPRNAAEPPLATDARAWRQAVRAIAKDARLPVGSSRIFVDTFFRFVSDREMVFLKRNEARFWTRTAAREDAEAALVHLLRQEDEDERKNA